MAEVTITVDTDDVKHLLASAYAFGVEEAIEVAKKVEAQLPWEPHPVVIRALQEAMNWPTQVGDDYFYHREAIRLLTAMHNDGVEFSVDPKSPMLARKHPSVVGWKPEGPMVPDNVSPIRRVPRAPRGRNFDQ